MGWQNVMLLNIIICESSEIYVVLSSSFVLVCVRVREYVLLLLISISISLSAMHLYACIKRHYKYMTIDKRNNKFNCMWSHNLLRRQFRPVFASFKNDIPTHTHTLKQIQTDFFNKNVYKRTHIYQWDDDERWFQFQKSFSQESWNLLSSIAMQLKKN